MLGMLAGVITFFGCYGADNQQPVIWQKRLEDLNNELQQKYGYVDIATAITADDSDYFTNTLKKLVGILRTNEDDLGDFIFIMGKQDIVPSFIRPLIKLLETLVQVNDIQTKLAIGSEKEFLLERLEDIYMARKKHSHFGLTERVEKLKQVLENYMDPSKAMKHFVKPAKRSTEENPRKRRKIGEG